jgi:hypothetical protein
MHQDPSAIWDELEREGREQPETRTRLYRALGESAVGIRAGYLPGKDMIELLIEVPDSWSEANVIPAWRGMGYEIVELALPPRRDALQLRLFLMDQEHREIFKMICKDIVACLEGITSAEVRVKGIEICLLRWRRFFEKAGTDGLSIEMQQGLFAELRWLNCLMRAGIHPIIAVESWKGCERAYHDFDIKGNVVEVKSTRSKEPLSVLISNERQLDDLGLESLHLYTLGIHVADGGGLALPAMVETLRSTLVSSPTAKALLKGKLLSAGYIEHHASLYTKHFIIKSENLYRVTNGFPRITVLPAGVGSLNYRVSLPACEQFRVSIKDFLMKLKRS